METKIERKKETTAPCLLVNVQLYKWKETRSTIFPEKKWRKWRKVEKSRKVFRIQPNLRHQEAWRPKFRRSKFAFIVKAKVRSQSSNPTWVVGTKISWRLETFSTNMASNRCTPSILNPAAVAFRSWFTLETEDLCSLIRMDPSFPLTESLRYAWNFCHNNCNLSNSLKWKQNRKVMLLIFCFLLDHLGISYSILATK